MAGRGQVTKHIQSIMENMHQQSEMDELDVRKRLRLLPYVYDRAINSAKLDPARIDAHERAIFNLPWPLAWWLKRKNKKLWEKGQRAHEPTS